MSNPTWCHCCGETIDPKDAHAIHYTHAPAAARVAYCGACGDPDNAGAEATVQLPDGRELDAGRLALGRDTAHDALPAWTDTVQRLARALDPRAVVMVDLLCYTRAAANAHGLQDEYDSDPEASVTGRMLYLPGPDGTWSEDYVGSVA